MPKVAKVISRNKSKSDRAAQGNKANIGQHRKSSPKPSKSTADEEVENLRKAEELGFVNQLTKFSVDRPGNVPREHQAKFQNIQTLGLITCNTYKPQPNPETVNKPWENENVKRAAQLKKIAVDCRKHMSNEATWREGVEYRLFDRFKIEVACKRCRKRLWKSEIEVDSSADNSRSNSLRERQARREPCKCGPASEMNDILDTGLSDLFSSRLEDKNTFTRNTEANLGLKAKYPDRIQGLNSTANLEKILHQQYETLSQHDSHPSKKLADVLQTSCNPDRGGKGVLFPFLVMEAKSATGGTFAGCEGQTALPICNLLELQYELHQHEFNHMKVPGGPLAWFLASVGDTWRVYGCYVTQGRDERPPKPSWNIILLWEGSVLGLNEALQLVLIVDYIVDWARDIYRPSIIRQLKCIAAMGANSAYTISQDPDILSIANPTRQWLGFQRGQASVSTIVAAAHASNEANITIEVATASERLTGNPLHVPYGFRLGNSDFGMVRYGTVLNSRTRGLYITTDNLGTFLQGFSGEIAQREFVCRIIDIFENRERCFVLPNAKALSEVENIWAGSSIHSTARSNTSCETLVSMEATFWVNEDWELVRELSYVAITRTAFHDLTEILTEVIGCSPRLRGVVKDLKSLSGEVLVSCLEQENKSFRDCFLLRCLERQVLILEHRPGLKFRRNGKLKRSVGLVSQIVSSIYNKYHIGHRKPDESFIRHLDAIEEVPADAEHALWNTHHEGILAKTKSSKLCLYVNSNNQAWVDPHRVTEGLVSRFTMAGKTFNARLANKDGALSRASPSKLKDWRSQSPLGSDIQALRNLVDWIISLCPEMTRLMKRELLRLERRADSVEGVV